VKSPQKLCTYFIKKRLLQRFRNSIKGPKQQLKLCLKKDLKKMKKSLI